MGGLARLLHSDYIMIAGAVSPEMGYTARLLSPPIVSTGGFL
jgi:hypothetical protein